MQRYNEHGERDEKGKYVLFEEATDVLSVWQDRVSDLEMIYGVQLTEQAAIAEKYRDEAIKYRALKETLSDLVK